VGEMLPKLHIFVFLLLTLLLASSGEVRAGINLQDLIDEANDGETVEIPGGTYNGPLTVNKAITIVGRENVRIISEGDQPAVTINNEGVTLKNIKVENSTAQYALLITGSHHVIKDVTVVTAKIGIRLSEASKIEIRNTKVIGKSGAQEAGNGIDLYRSKENLIVNNTIKDIRDGIYVEYSDDNEVIGNTVTRSRYGLHFMYTQDNVVKNNTFIDNHTGSMIMVSENELYEGNFLLKNRKNVNSQGLYLYDVQHSLFKNNHIKDNRIGIMIDNSFTNKILQNDFQGNALGIIFKQSTDNRIFKNDFKNNVTTILTYGDGSKDNELLKNYWDNQMGLDANGDKLSDLEIVADPYFMEITDKNSSFQLLFQSPGMVLMEKLFKSNETSLVKDPTPVMIPNIREEAKAERNLGVMYISIFFILSSTSLFLLGRKKFQ
jgi:nitrous oxidase accessory protein